MSSHDERRPLETLGSPPRVRVTKVVRTSYRLEWEYDGHEFSSDGMEPARKRRARYIQSKSVAYRMAAWRLIFARRDRYSTGFGPGGKSEGCRLCNDNPVTFESERGPRACRYHDDEVVSVIRDRLARRLRWRDERTAT